MSSHGIHLRWMLVVAGAPWTKVKSPRCAVVADILSAVHQLDVTVMYQQRDKEAIAVRQELQLLVYCLVVIYLLVLT